MEMGLKSMKNERLNIGIFIVDEGKKMHGTERRGGHERECEASYQASLM